MRSIDKFRGCMIGGAVGDALGYPIEFMLEKQIFEKYGDSGINQFKLKNGIAQISDDTQMSLFTANGILLSGKNENAIEEIRNCYKEWYRTQTEYTTDEQYDYSWLMTIPELFSQRVPGITCLGAIANGAGGSVNNPRNISKGNGGLMRVAPIGLYFSGSNVDTSYVDMLGAEAAALTHGHELGFIPAAAFVHIIRFLLEHENASIDEAVLESLSAMQTLFKKARYLQYFTALINDAIFLSKTCIQDLDAIHKLGVHGVAEETLAVAVYCSIRYADDFEKGIIASVNHNGDSDTVGAVTGNILGAFLGYDAIPFRFKQYLELHDLIYEVAEDLFYAPNEDDPIWYSKYVSREYRKH